MMELAKKKIETVDSDETNLGLSIVYRKPPFIFLDLNVSKVFFNINRDKTKWIIYMTRR